MKVVRWNVILQQQKLTVGFRQFAAIQLDGYQVFENTLFVRCCTLMAVLEGIGQMGLGTLVLVFEHGQAADVIPVCYHFRHASLFGELFRLDGTDQVLAKPQNIESKVHSKEFVDNAEDSGLLTPLGIKGSSRLVFGAVVEGFGVGILENGDSLLEFGVVVQFCSATGRSILVGGQAKVMGCLANDNQRWDHPISFRRTEQLIEFGVDLDLGFECGFDITLRKQWISAFDWLLDDGKEEHHEKV